MLWFNVLFGLLVVVVSVAYYVIKGIIYLYYMMEMCALSGDGEGWAAQNFGPFKINLAMAVRDMLNYPQDFRVVSYGRRELLKAQAEGRLAEKIQEIKDFAATKEAEERWARIMEIVPEFGSAF